MHSRFWSRDESGRVLLPGPRCRSQEAVQLRGESYSQSLEELCHFGTRRFK